MILNFKTLLFKPTKKCNATCSHCAAINNKDKNMSLEEAKEVIDKIAKYVYNKCSLIIHGGEASLLGVKYYDKLIEYTEKNYPGKFTYSMQSNMLLYNSEWFNIIKKWNIGVSTSYDFFSDLRNLRGNVKKYWDIWYNNIKQFQEDMTNNLGYQYYPYVINIVTKQNYTKYNEIYEIAKKEKFNIRHNYFYKVGRGDKNSNKYYIESEKYGDFLVKTFNLWLKDLKNNNINPKKYKIFPQDYFIEKMIIDPKNAKDNNMCPWTCNCTGTFANIEPNGEFYNCSEMSDINAFSFGNILEMEDLREIMTKENFKKLYNRRLKLPKDCLSCKYLQYCKGGCMRDSYINEKSFGDLYSKTWACKSWKMIMEKIEINKDFLLNNL